jgi:bifunctional UDP-N-acetylglucosamine pyrophosphorylase/glucosamine-1-phosphate N-acetyltransferase
MNVVVLAAGMGKRMNSALPKVLHPIAGRPMLMRVLDTARQLPDARITVVIGHGGDQVRNAVADLALHWAVQEPQRGTGHAVQQAVPFLDDAMPTLVLYGDVPLTRAETLRDLSTLTGDGSDDVLALLTVTLDEPTGYGRIVRDADGNIAAIVEEKDASPSERAITEVNTGILVAPTRALKRWLGSLTNDNAQGEYYLTDIVALARRDGVSVVATQPAHVWETVGVNSKAQLAELERQAQRNEADRLLAAGVTLMDAARIDVRGTLACGRDVSIDVGCVFEGEVHLADGVTVGPYAVLRDATVQRGARIGAFNCIDGAASDSGRITIGEGEIVAPHARR